MLGWPVTKESGPRPAGDPDKCFYCGRPIGQQHADECVVRSRSVVIRMTVEYAVLVPESWDAEKIHFHRNEGSWCASNALEEIGRQYDCICGAASFEYVREATDKETGDAGLDLTRPDA